eukprot:scaffold139075_cov14-Tisochrysis_lutea.AAC.1
MEEKEKKKCVGTEKLSTLIEEKKTRWLKRTVSSPRLQSNGKERASGDLEISGSPRIQNLAVM